MTGRVIDLHTGTDVARAIALRDGHLIDASRRAKAAGFNVPVAFTRAAYDTLGPDPAQRVERVAAALDLAFFAVVGADRRAVTIEPDTGPLVVHVGPGDTPAPVVTIALPEEI